MWVLCMTLHTFSSLHSSSLDWALTLSWASVTFSLLEGKCWIGSTHTAMESSLVWESSRSWSPLGTKCDAVVVFNVIRGQCCHTGAAFTILCTKALLSTKRRKYYIIKSSWKQSSGRRGISGNSISFSVWVGVFISDSRVAFSLSSSY